MDKEDIKRLNNDLMLKEPYEIISYAIKNFPGINISFSGAEDVVLIDMAIRTNSDFNVFTLDTGRLHPETYRFLDRVREHYGIKIDVMFPRYTEVERLASDKGFFSFYKDSHNECCRIRKVEPLKRRLSGINAWITGQRHDQNPGTRANIPIVQMDPTFFDDRLVKFNPLANWTLKQVWLYILENKVPYNELHDRGYISIGCEPCTKSINPGEHERDGRWWWESNAKKECGLHFGNIKQI
ncbi:MAG TPA: phosphoadenylyl-sulfate reductase [Halobacteria archaeon]|jgi:phosphoadenosine phosphosulfate reductase|nr:phosphoadenylyl-sulfate reductase [Halobacteria archaeon]